MMTRSQFASAWSERDLEEAVRALCVHLGLEVNHFPDSRRSWLPGWPDLEILGTRIIHRELKTQRGVLSPAQRRVGSRIMKAGGDWAVWRPADYLDGTIEHKLRELV